MRVAVVGGGIAGLTAAYRLRTLLGPTAEITVLESTERVGGKIRTEIIDGAPVDVGAEAFLVRRPEALDLIAELGLDGLLVHTSGARPTVRAGGRTVELPGRTLMGIPADAAQLDGVLSAAGVRAVEAEASLPPVELPAGVDVNLGQLLRARFGDELVDRLTSPLLAGVYGASADVLGLRAVLPGLADAVDRGATSLTAAARGLLPPPSASLPPVFGTLRGGLGVLVDRLAEPVTVVCGSPVHELSRSSEGWRVHLGGSERRFRYASGSESVVRYHFDGVLLAVPPPAARRLLAGVSDAASTAYAEVDQASMAVVTLALPVSARLPEASGVLIEDGQRRRDGSPLLSKAMTFSSRKWQHMGESGVYLRASVGRYGSNEELRLTDEALVDGVRADLAELTGITAEPVAVNVQRWGGGLPHYGVQHADRVGRIERAVAEVPGLEVAGAVLHGVGIPACIGTGDAAARRLAEQLKVQN